MEHGEMKALPLAERIRYYRDDILASKIERYRAAVAVFEANGQDREAAKLDERITVFEGEVAARALPTGDLRTTP